VARYRIGLESFFQCLEKGDKKGPRVGNAEHATCPPKSSTKDGSRLLSAYYSIVAAIRDRGGGLTEPALQEKSDLELFRAGGEHFIAVLGDEEGVFDADAAEIGVIKARLDGDNVASTQFLMIGR